MRLMESKTKYMELITEYMTILIWRDTVRMEEDINLHTGTTTIEMIVYCEFA